MTDIVGRLRKSHDNQAANEIERLRKALRDAETSLARNDIPGAGKIILGVLREQP